MTKKKIIIYVLVTFISLLAIFGIFKLYQYIRIKTAKIEISIEPAVKDEFMTLVRNEGKTASVEIGLWIRDYIKNNKLEEEK